MAIRFIVTDAGRAALTNDDNTGTGARQIAEIGLGRGQYTASDRSRTDLADPIKRIDTIGGETVAPDIIHVTLQDETNDTYSVGEIGLFLDNGVLFAYYSQPDDWIIEKAAPATLLLATDIEIADIDVSSLMFGDAAFLNPPATTTVQGVVELATDTEALERKDKRRAVTPSNLAAFGATTSRSGFVELATDTEAQGKSGDQVITASNLAALGATTSRPGLVELATSAETQAGEDNRRAVTPAALNSRKATTSRTGLVEQATETEAKAGAANVFPDAAGVVAAFQQYGLGVQGLPDWPLASFNDNPLNVPSGLYRLTSTTDGTPQGSGCIIWMRYNGSQYGTAMFMPYSGYTIYTRSYRFDTRWSAWVMGLDENNHRAATNSQAIAGTATNVWASPSSVAAHVQSLGWGATAPEIGALFDNDFDKWVNQDIVGTVSGDWKNGPYGNSAHTGVLMQLARTYNNGIAQIYFDTSRGESFYRCNTGSGTRTWQKYLTDGNFRVATVDETVAGDANEPYLSPKRGWQLIQNFGLATLQCPDWPLEDLNADPTGVRSGLYRITSAFNRPGGPAVVLWTRYNLSTGSMLLIEQTSGMLRNRGYGSGSWASWSTMIQSNPSGRQRIDGTLELFASGHASLDNQDYGAVIYAFEPGVGFVDRSSGAGGGVLYYNAGAFYLVTSPSDTDGSAAIRSDKVELIRIGASNFYYQGNEVWHEDNLRLPGAIVAFPVTSPPKGWLECDGANLRKSSYPRLFGVVGTTFGGSDTSQNFSLPDLRGEFIRGWAHDRGVDSGRAMGSSQGDTFSRHSHTGTTDSDTHSHGGTTNTTGDHYHGDLDEFGLDTNGSGSDGKAYADYGDNSPYSTRNAKAGAHSHSLNINSDTHNHSFRTDTQGGDETRPRNVALMYCIKY